MERSDGQGSAISDWRGSRCAVGFSGLLLRVSTTSEQLLRTWQVIFSTLMYYAEHHNPDPEMVRDPSIKITMVRTWSFAPGTSLLAPRRLHTILASQLPCCLAMRSAFESPSCPAEG